MQSPAARRGVQGRAEHTAGGMRAVSTDREEIRGKRNSFRQGQFQAPEALARSERNRLTAPAGQGW